MAPGSDPDASLDAVRARRGGRSARVRLAVLAAVRDELAAGGYAAVAHTAVARAAGVDPTTVYRRWPTRARLVADALLEMAASKVPVPDTGELAGDLLALHRSICATLDAQPGRRLVQAIVAAAGEDDEVATTVRTFWAVRFAGARALFERAAQRGELPGQPSSEALVEQLIAPIYFRLLVTGEPLDEAFTAGCVAAVVRLAQTDPG